jgi:hypothetical protein
MFSGVSGGVWGNAASLAVGLLGGGSVVALYTYSDRTNREKAHAQREVVADYIDAVSDVANLVYNLPVIAATGKPSTSARRQDTGPIRDAFRRSSRAQTRFDLLIADDELRAQQRKVDAAEGLLMVWVAQYDVALDPDPRRISKTEPVNLNEALVYMNAALAQLQALARRRLPR